ncbi:NAD(P)/FAD-dependent oxidoreductase [Haloarchaeobius sp. HME9146]|uniref:NAD(P)/FAD-dependent oxidoreductase n=1 Tax=Haloarchaeobius sp. HME9146 TaxID=2978732 RepID=UPI0021BF3D45|nr:FAD-dependent oxidoreductase [Haloarchaeobius sp. HME9146]MCT9096264.1 FAD-dependent oxidoreductase [Haloarchaeobius sp. HME9146]
MKVAVLGAGYAGVTLTKRLEKSLPDDVELVLVDDTGVHLIQHELHRVVRRPAVTDAITVPLSDVIDRATLRVGRVTEVDTDARTVFFADDTRLEYDVAAVCLGAETAFYDLPGVEAHATPLKRLEDANEIRADFFDVLESEGDGQVVVGGAGLSGIQVAGELAELADEEDGDVTVTLLEQLDSVAPSFPENFQNAVHDALVARGVHVRTGATVTEATDDEVRLAGADPIAYDQLIWTGGIRGPDALHGERPVVRSNLQLDGTTFVVGDAAKVVDDAGAAVPASAQSAIREAKVTGKNVERLVSHLRDGDSSDFQPRFERYTFESPGWLVTVGNGAVAQVGPSVFTGRAALTLKTTVGAGYLSSVGAIEEAVDLVNEELGISPHEEP